MSRSDASNYNLIIIYWTRTAYSIDIIINIHYLFIHHIRRVHHTILIYRIAAPHTHSPIIIDLAITRENSLQKNAWNLEWDFCTRLISLDRMRF